MAGQDWTFWFNMTNFALGMITVLAVAVVCGAVGWDLFALWLHKARKTDTVTDSDLANITADLRAHWQDGPHMLTVPGLGSDDGRWRLKKSSLPRPSPNRNRPGSDLWRAHFSKKVERDTSHAAPVQKLILDGPGAADGGRCASPGVLQVRMGRAG